MSTVLILQAKALSEKLVAEAQCLLSAGKATAISSTACRFHIEHTFSSVFESWANHNQVDIALLKQPFSSMPFNQIGLVVSDMDSTLITIECIDEIAAEAGLKSAVAAITEKAMQGQLDFSTALQERVRLLSGLPESVLEVVYQKKLQLTPGATTLIDEVKHCGGKFMLVSGGFKFFTDRIKQKFNLDYAYANELEILNGRLTGRINGPIVNGSAKAEYLISARQSLGLDPDQVIAIGDGANDLPMIHEAGIGIAFHAKPIVRQQADVALNFVGLDGVRNLFL